MTERPRAGVELLFGRDHHEIGQIVSRGIKNAAICLSRGGAPKTYSHTDPNEDCALAAVGEGGWLLAVADGHHGESGSEAALEQLALEWVERLLGSATFEAKSWPEIALDILHACGTAVLRRAAELETPQAPTTLSLALIRPVESLCAWASMGDSHVFVADEEGVRDHGWQALGRDRAYFVGYEASSRAALVEQSVIGYQPLNTTRSIVLATDGLSERGIGVPDPAVAVAEALRASAPLSDPERALELAERVAELALAAHRAQNAGDNIACAVLDLHP